MIVLCYHRIVSDYMGDLSGPYHIRKQTFERHIRLLHELNINVVCLGEIFRKSSYPTLPSETTAIITFDDGHVSNYTLSAEILTGYRLKATFFITTSLIDSGDDWLTSSQLREMSANGMEIGSHTHSHRYLNELNDGEVTRELSISKTILEGITGQTIEYLSCPGGRYKTGIAKVAKESGYTAICTSKPGVNRKLERCHSPVVFLERYILRGDITDKCFKNIVMRKTSTHIANAVYILKKLAWSVLGNETYYSIWEKRNLKS